jgi:hypothetical protein
VSTLAIVSGSLNGATLQDDYGHFPDVSGLVTSLAGVEIVAPPTTVTGVITNPASGVEGLGETVLMTVSFNHDVFVTGGTPTLALNDGGTAAYDAAATAALGDLTKLVFSYTVSETDTAVPTLAITGGSLNGATLRDAAGSFVDTAGVLTDLPIGVDPGMSFEAMSNVELPPHHDAFIFTAETDSTITDFNAGSDLIDFTAIDADTGTSGDDAFIFGGQNNSVVANSITWFHDGADTVIYADNNGDVTADFAMTLTGLHTLTAADFLL